MNKLFAAIVSGVLALAAMTTVHAEGDPQAGKAKAAACAACHGPDGNSPNGQWPTLASQHPRYIVYQLKAFKSGERQNPVMQGMAAGLSEQDMEDIAAYYAQQEIRIGSADPALVEKGQALYRGGDAENGIPACTACHGPSGLGNGPALYPRLSGQHAEYVALALRAYRDGQRTASPKAEMMSEIAGRLTDEQIRAVSSYVEGLHP